MNGKPDIARAWDLLEEGKVEEAERLFSDCLPRNSDDARDPRYFGIYWGLAEVARQGGRRVEAFGWMTLAIEHYPLQLRPSHLRRLEEMGLDLAHVRLQESDGLAETDASAIATKVVAAIRSHPDCRDLRFPIIGRRMEDLSRRLE